MPPVSPTTPAPVPPAPERVRIALATEPDREIIYRLRHEVYARELKQHSENPEGTLRDSLDLFNSYIVASLGSRIVGFISITPPGHPSYSIDKYLSRDRLPFPFDDRLYEIRILTVVEPCRSRSIAALLMYAAFRWVEAQGGARIMAMGRREVMSIYLKAGLEPVGIEIQSGAVTFEVMSATTAAMRRHLGDHTALLRRLRRETDWQLSIPFHRPSVCFHGGAFFDAIGDEFDRLDRLDHIINADVLDAWYPPSPKVLAALQRHFPWLLQTSPPVHGAGMARTIARVRGVPAECILPGAGSSSLIFLAFRQWLTPASRALVLDPSYGEYAHVLEEVVGCRVDRLTLSRGEGYRLDLSRLDACLAAAYDLVVLVNPNSPTGSHVPREDLERVLQRAPRRTRVWVDETYVEYAGADQSLERFAAREIYVVVCKSMSKVYALSGVRAAYLCAGANLIEELRAITPPWAVSLPAQVAAVMALRDPEYYSDRYQETHALRARLVEALANLGNIEIVPGVANFLLCHLPPEGPDAASVVRECREHGLYLRDAGRTSSLLGRHALRIAVKDAETNGQILGILARVLRNSPSGTL